MQRDSDSKSAIRGWQILCLMVLINQPVGARDESLRQANVVLITVDTLRADHLGCYGYERDTSPNIDALAAESVLFTDAVAQWPKTSPSVASLMTGTYSSTNGVKRICGQRFPRDFESLASSLHRAGFATGGIVTNRFLGTQFGFDRGFEHFVEVWETGRDDAKRATDEALSWLATRERGRPFFLWLHYLDPHAPYEPPEPYHEIFVNDPFYQKNAVVRFSEGNDDMAVVPTHAQLNGQYDQAYYVAQYDAEIRFMDSQVARVLSTLDAMSLSATTMVALTADHGESLGDHNYFFEHGRLPYDACLRIPLMIKVPWLSSQRGKVDQPVELLNLMPTILDVFGLPALEKTQGVSLLPTLAGRQQALPDAVFAEAGYSKDHLRIIRQGRWKLISVPDVNNRAIMTNARYELYDIETDPGELLNLASERPDLVDSLSGRLASWATSTQLVIASPPEVVPLDQETKEALKSLGYVKELEP